MPRSDPITLLLCTHNRGRRLRETLDAIRAMDMSDTPDGRVRELLIVNNASTDDTPQVIDEAAAAPGLPIRRVDEARLGAIHARRRAVRESSTPLIAWLDDDVIPDRAWASAILARLDADPNAGVVGSRITLRWEAGPTRLALRFRAQLAEQELGDTPFVLERPDAGLATAALAARRDAIEDSGWLTDALLAGPTGDRLLRGEDYEMVIRVRQAGWNAWYEPASRVHHLIPAQRQTREYLSRLAFGIGQSTPWLTWMAEGRPGAEWVDSHIARIERRIRRSRWLECRPTRRVCRLHGREGRLDGLRMLREHIIRGAAAPAWPELKFPVPAPEMPAAGSSAAHPSSHPFTPRASATAS